MTSAAFYPELDAALRTYLQAAFAHFREQYQHEHFYAAGLGMVEDICGFFMVGNTLERLANLHNSLVGESLDDQAYYYWSISEWAAAEFSGLPNLVHNAATAISDGLGDGAYGQFRLDYQDHILNVLADMRSQGLLRNAQGEEIWVWVQYADAYDEDFDDVSFARLNPAELSALFVRRYDDNTDNLSTTVHTRMQELNLLD